VGRIDRALLLSGRLGTPISCTIVVRRAAPYAVTVAATRRSFGQLLRWARGVGGERVWALEDCRHVSGSLERFLLGAAYASCVSRRS
jgi:hypothetical protein